MTSARRLALLVPAVLALALAGASSASAAGGITDTPAFQQVQNAACGGYGGQPPVLCGL